MTRKHAVLILILIVLSVPSASAQVSTSSITGAVTDASGAVVASAKVEAKNEETGVTFVQNTTSSGNYSFASLTPGSYSITVTLAGFQTFRSVHNVLTVGTPLVVDVSLRVGTVGQTVEVVESNYQRLETSNATVSDIMDTKQVQNLPLNGRNPLSLLTLEPGVVQRTFGGAGSGTHVFGSRDRSHNVTIDGIDANESTVPNPQSNIQRLNPDNVQEFRTVTLGATAEEGRNSGANVMVATKGGGNGLHGSIYYFNRNTAYNANEWFNNANRQARPELKLHQYGFDVGGPIKKDKTFFFGSFQNNSIKQSAPISSIFGTPLVYTSTLRNGIYRFVRGTVTANGKSFSRNDQQLVDANGNLQPGIAICSAANGFQNCVDSYNIFANDPGGTGSDPATFGFLKSLPLPNAFSGVGSACSACIAPADGLNNAGFNWNPPTEFTGPHYMVRVDHTFGPKDSIFVRWLQNHYNTNQGDFINARPQVYPGFSPLGEVSRLGKNLAISYRRTFSSNLVNEFTAGFNRFAFAFTFGESNPNFGDPSKLPPWADGCLFSPDSFQNINSPLCVSPHTQRAVTTPQFVDNLSWIHGAHTVRAGINFRFYIHNDSRGFFGSNALVPAIFFDGSNRPGGFTSIPAQIGTNKATAPNSADISRLQQAIAELAGIPYSISQSYYANFAANTYGNPLHATVYTRAHQYDSYVQDEWKLRPNLTLNLGVRWEYNPAPYDAKQALVPNVFPDGSQGTVTYVKADSWFKNNNLSAVGPRLGVAWSPDKKTSVRAGYAWLFDTLSTFQVTAIAGKMPGFLLGCVSTNDGAGGVATTPNCVPPTGTANRISQGYPLSIATPTAAPSLAVTVPQQVGSTAPGVGAFDPNLKNPSVHEWSLTVQRELPLHFVAEVGYIGKRGTHLYRAYDLNQGSVNQPGFLASFNIARANVLAGCNGDGTSTATCTSGQTPTLLLQLVSPAFINGNTSKTDLQRGNIGNFATRMDNLALTSSQRRALPLNYVRPNAQFGQIFFQDSGGDSYYHGLFFSARRRFEQGLDSPHWLNQIIGGWSLTGLFIYQSGEPYTISSGARTSNALHNSTALIVGPNIRGGQLQSGSGIIGPVMYQTGGFITAPLNDPHLNCQNVTGTQTFFCIPPPGQNGSGRNSARGPNYWNLDSGLLKNFDLTERLKLQFRAEFFNVLNHPNFENPRNATQGSPTVTSGLFGQTCCATAAVASAQNVNPVGEPMRVMQLGLKLNF